MALDVLHVIHQFLPHHRGGSETYVLDVAKRQQRIGLAVEVLSGSHEWRPQVEVVREDVEGLVVHRLHRNDQYFDHHAKMWHPEVERRFEALLRERRPGIVHVHQWLRLTCNLVEVCARVGVPAVVTLHDYYSSCPRAFRRRVGDEACRRPLSADSCRDCVPKYGYEPKLEIDAGIELFRDHFRAELAHAAAVLVAVDSTAELLAATTGVPRARYATLPLGYQPRFRGMTPLAAPSADRPIRFAFWGGVGRHKGVDVLLRALRRLHAARPGRAELHVLGGVESPELAAELRVLAEGLPVTMHGRFEAAQLHAVAPHVGVFPSTCIETYGLVLDECFELGLPCVTSDLGALPERAGGAGLRTRAGDDADLAAALQRFVDEPALWAQLCARRPAASASLEAHVEALSRIYARARASPPQPPFCPPVGPDRRIDFLMLQRETALSRAMPQHGPR
ncbi:MAG: glycosyltransferase [Planctomycetes bacterium]|nr:glycosyltransferase [Planctomycetota bacterium]